MKQEPEIARSQLYKDWPNIVEHLNMVAKLHRQKYLALLGEGFTEAQALELCKDVLNSHK